METGYLLLCLMLAATSFVEGATKCQPRERCHLPKCRCWNDPIRPGGFGDDGTPQMIALTFSGAMNDKTTAHYLPLLKGLTNPNGCPVNGTFFVQDSETTAATIAALHKLGYEIGITSADPKVPTGRKGWAESLFKSFEKVYDADLETPDITGMRAPSFQMGGNSEFKAAEQFQLKYEASCVLDGSILWPFTHDFSQTGPKCAFGQAPNMSFPGVWQFLLPEMSIKGKTCASLASCSQYVKTADDAFILLMDTFKRHYYGGRAPMVLNVDLAWLAHPIQVQGLQQFLEVVSEFSDTWMVSLNQAMQWLKYPVPLYNSVKFMPWECSVDRKMQAMGYVDVQ